MTPLDKAGRTKLRELVADLRREADEAGPGLVIAPHFAVSAADALDAAELKAEGWEADALTYAKNAAFWRARAERAEAALAQQSELRKVAATALMAMQMVIRSRPEPLDSALTNMGLDAVCRQITAILTSLPPEPK